MRDEILQEIQERVTLFEKDYLKGVLPEKIEEAKRNAGNKIEEDLMIRGILLSDEEFILNYRAIKIILLEADLKKRRNDFDKESFLIFKKQTEKKIEEIRRENIISIVKNLGEAL